AALSRSWPSRATTPSTKARNWSSSSLSAMWFPSPDQSTRCAAQPPRLFVVLGASCAGKSSFLREGLWPRLARPGLFGEENQVFQVFQVGLSNDMECDAVSSA